MNRNAILQKIVRDVLFIPRLHPTRVAIDGIDASGKTMFADELTAALKELAPNREIVRATIDGWHHPKAVRMKNGSGPETYYNESHDYPAVRKLLLDPLGPGGRGVYISEQFDFRTDSAVECDAHKAAHNAVLIMDGIFLQRPELRDAFDYTVFLYCDFDVSFERALKRDVDLFGSGEKTIEKYRTRYIPGQQMYLDEVDPESLADVVIDNNDWENPKLIRMPDSWKTEFSNLKID